MFFITESRELGAVIFYPPSLTACKYIDRINVANFLYKFLEAARNIQVEKALANVNCWRHSGFFPFTKGDNLLNEHVCLSRYTSKQYIIKKKVRKKGFANIGW